MAAIFLGMAGGSAGLCDDGVPTLDRMLFESKGESYSLVPESVQTITGIRIAVEDVRHSKPGWKVVTFRADKDIEGLFLLAPGFPVGAHFPVRFELEGGDWKYSFDTRQRVDAAIIISGSTYFFEATSACPKLATDSPDPQQLYAPVISIAPDFFSVLTTGLTGPISLEAGLNMRGVDLPPGAAVFRGAATGQFIMMNTKSNHEKLAKFIADYWGDTKANK